MGSNPRRRRTLRPEKGHECGQRPRSGNGEIRLCRDWEIGGGGVMKHLLALISMSLCFSSCNEKRKLPVIEMLNISNAYVNDEGYPAIEFQIKNIQETPICLPISIFNGNHTYYANLEIKTKYGRQLKEKRINGRPGIDDAWKFLRIEPNAQDSSFIAVSYTHLTLPTICSV